MPKPVGRAFRLPDKTEIVFAGTVGSGLQSPALLPDSGHFRFDILRQRFPLSAAQRVINLKTIAASGIGMDIHRIIRRKGIALLDFFAGGIVLVRRAADANRYTMALQFIPQMQCNGQIDVLFFQTVADSAGITAAVPYTDKNFTHVFLLSICKKHSFRWRRPYKTAFY